MERKLSKESNVIELHPTINLSDTLRNIADQLDNNEYYAENATLIVGDIVVHASNITDNMYFKEAVYNMERAKLSILIGDYEQIYEY